MMDFDHPFVKGHLLGANVFGVSTRTKEDRKAEDRADRTERIMRDRAASVAMLFAAIESLPAQQALNMIVVAIKDSPAFSPEQIETMANELGREAHDRARREAL